MIGEGSNNPLQLLVALTADSEATKTNFQSVIDGLKTKISAEFEIEAKISDSAIKSIKSQVTSALQGVEFNPEVDFKGKGFKDLERQLDGALKQIEELKRLGQQFGQNPLGGGSGGSSKPSQNPFKPLEVEAVRSIDSIEQEFRNMNIDFKIVEKFKGEQRELEKVIFEVQRAFGKIEKIEFAPAIDMKGMKGLTELKSSLSDFDTFDMEKNLISLENKLTDLYRTAKLSSDEFKKFSSELRLSESNSEIEQLNRKVQQTANLNALKITQSKQELDLTKQIAKIENDMVMLAKRYPRHADVDGLIKEQQYLIKIREEMSRLQSMKMPSGMTGLSPQAAKDLQVQLGGVEQRFASIRAQAAHASRDSLTIVDAFKVAMERFPIWMAASTAFYGSVRTAREFATIIVDIDTKMTDLAKVMSADTDFAGLFDRATQSAEAFGQSISQVLDSYTEFARQGYGGEELGLLADAGLVASNVGDITAQKASEYMTASLIQWKKDANEAMGIIDSWNEISNNYATTTEKLAQGQSRAGATARAMGLEFDQVNAIIGTVTAATKQSGNEVGNFLKNVLPRLVGQPAQDAMSSLGVSLTDNEGNLRDIIEVYTEIANKVKGISDSERIAVTEGLAGKFHISRMQALLDDLGSADSMYRSMYESSVNSAGSANEENERYMKSLQARINLARVEVEKLALAMGEAFLTEGMVQGIKVFSEFLQASTKLTEVVGALPVLFGVLGVALFTLSTRFRTLIAAMTTGTATMKSKTAALVGLSSGMSATAATTTIATNALRGFATATVLGGVLMIAGVAIEKLIAKMGESRKKAEEMEETQRSLMKTYQENASDIDTLSERYTQLSNVMQNGTPEEATAASEEYFDVQQQLADLLPDLVMGEDEKGRKILANSDTVKGYTAFLKEQLAVEKELAALENREKQQENYSTAIENAQKKAEELQSFVEKELKYSLKSLSESGIGNDFLDVGSVETYDQAVEAINKLETRRKQFIANGDVASLENAQQISDTISEYRRLTSEYDALSLTRQQADRTVALENAKLTSTIIDNNHNMSESSKGVAKSIGIIASTAVTNSDSVQKFYDLFNQELEINGQLEKPLTDYSTAMDELIAKNKEGLNGKELANYRNLATKSFDDVSQRVMALAQNSGATQEEITELSRALNEQKLSIDNYGLTVEQVASKMNITVDEARNMMSAIEDTGNASEESANQIKSYSDALDGVIGVTKEQNERVGELLMTIDLLSSIQGRNEEQTRLLKDAQQELSSIYPEMSRNTETRIENIRMEHLANEQLLKIVQAAKDGQLDAEEMATLGQLLNTNNRIKNINSEIGALETLVNAYSNAMTQIHKTAEGQRGTLEQLAKAGDEDAARALMRISQVRQTAIGQISLREAELASATAARSKGLNSLSHYYDENSKSASKNSAATKKNSDAAKKSSSSTKESIYITDKFKQALEAVNAAIERQNRITATFPKHSKAYRDSLNKEIGLLKQKQKLIQDQANSLAKQISSGKIKQTGTITSTTPASSSTTTTHRQLSGWGGRVTSNYGWRKDPITGQQRWHAGVDLAGARGTRLDSNVNGRVTYAGNKGNGFGNYVEIVDSAGLKHIYAHLDSVAVKIGQEVSKGLKIGAIGSTGRSTGSHLHYEVRNSSNKDINPMSYLNSAKSGASVTKTTTVAGKQVISTVDTTQKAIDDAKSALIDLQLDAMSVAETIKQLEREILNSFLAGYEARRSQYQQYINHEQAISQLYDKNSKKYYDSLTAQRKHMEVQAKAAQEEMNYLQKQIKYGKLSAAVVDELTRRYEDLRIEAIGIQDAIFAVRMEYWQNRLRGHDEEIDDIQFLIDLSREYSGLLVKGSEEYTKEVAKQNKLIKQQQEALNDKKRIIEAALKNTLLTSEQHKELKEQLEEIVLEYWRLENVMAEVNANLADNLIDLMKQVYEKQKESALKAIDDERKAYQKLINDKINMLNDQFKEEDYLAEKKKKQDEMRALQDRINLLALDDSNYARAQRKKLMDELGALEEDYLKFITQKEREERQEALEKQLEQKEEELDEKAEKEERYWEDLINDERAWAEIRKDIMDGVVDEHIAKLGEMAGWVTSNFEEIGNSIGQNMVDKLKETIELMKEIEKLKITPPNEEQYKDDQSTPNTPTNSANPSKPSGKAPAPKPAPKPTTGGSSGGSSPSTKISRTLQKGARGEDVKALQRKLGVTADGIFGDKTRSALIAYQKKNGLTADGIAGQKTLTKMGLWKAPASSGGSSSGSSSGSGSSASKQNQRMTTMGLNFRKTAAYGNNVMSVIPKNAKVELISSSGGWAKVKYNGKTGFVGASFLKKFDTGGMTDENLPSSGGLAILHKKELVLNQGETKDFITALKILRELNISSPVANLPASQDSQVIQTIIENLVKIENFNGTKKEIDKLSNTIIGKLGKRGVTIKP